MGCGISMFDPEDLAGPTCEFNPLRQNNVHPIDHQDVDSLGDHGRKSISSPAKDKGVVKDQAVKEIKTRRVCSDDSMEKERALGKKEPGKKKVSAKAVQEEEGLRKEEVEEDRQNEEEEKDHCDKREDSLIGPASPSFRDYWMDSDSWGSSNNGNGDGAKSENKSQKEGSLDSNKVCRTQIAKEERKGRGFRSVLHKGRPAGVKFFLNAYHIPNYASSRGSFLKLVGKSA